MYCWCIKKHDNYKNATIPPLPHPYTTFPHPLPNLDKKHKRQRNVQFCQCQWTLFIVDSIYIEVVPLGHV